MSAVTTEAREVLQRLRTLLQGDGAIGKRERAALAEFIAAALEWEVGDEPDFEAFALSAAGGHLGAAVDELMAERAELLQALECAEAGLEFAGADDQKEVGGFVPTPLLALRYVRAAIAKAKGTAS